MIISKFAKVRCNSSNKHYLLSKGYEWVWGNELTVKLEDLSKTNSFVVKVQCRYCKETKDKKYRDVIKTIKNSPFQEYSCSGCRKENLRATADWKQSRGELKPGEHRYWSYKENRMKELKAYIEQNGTASGLWGKSQIAKMFTDYQHDLDEALIELGYEPHKIKGKANNGYYDDFEVIKEEIEQFMAIHNRFPSYDEFKTELNISMNHILKHGGIHELKRKFNITHNEFVDLRGFYNSSSFEYIVANFLIANNISYKREQLPFPSENYRSDFTFYTKDNRTIHCELWGYGKNSQGKVADHYNRVRLIKEKLYKQHQLELISLELSMFKAKSYESIQNDLIHAFSPVLNVDLKEVEQHIVIPPSKLSDKELHDEVTKQSEDATYFPHVTRIPYGIAEEIRKRYDSYEKFATKMGKQVRFQSWDESKFLDKFNYMFKTYQRILGTRELIRTKDPNLTGFYQAVQNRTNWTDAKIDFYKHCLQNNITIPDEELSIMVAYAEQKGAYKGITLEQREAIRVILSKIPDLLSEKGISSKEHRKWTDDVCFKLFETILSEYGEIPGIKKAKKLGLGKDYISMYNAVHTREGFIKMRLRFYQYCVKENVILPDKELSNLKKITNGTAPYTKISEEDKQLAFTLFQSLHPLLTF